MSKRTDLIQMQVAELIGITKQRKDRRDDLRDNAAQMLTDAQDLFDAARDERDERLVRLNQLRVLEGLPELTLADIRKG